MFDGRLSRLVKTLTNIKIDKLLKIYKDHSRWRKVLDKRTKYLGTQLEENWPINYSERSTLRTGTFYGYLRDC